MTNIAISYVNTPFPCVNTYLRYNEFMTSQIYIYAEPKDKVNSDSVISISLPYCPRSGSPTTKDATFDTMALEQPNAKKYNSTMCLEL